MWVATRRVIVQMSRMARMENRLTSPRFSTVFSLSLSLSEGDTFPPPLKSRGGRGDPRDPRARWTGSEFECAASHKSPGVTQIRVEKISAERRARWRWETRRSLPVFSFSESLTFRGLVVWRWIFASSVFTRSLARTRRLKRRFSCLSEIVGQRCDARGHLREF